MPTVLVLDLDLDCKSLAGWLECKIPRPNGRCAQPTRAERLVWRLGVTFRPPGRRICAMYLRDNPVLVHELLVNLRMKRAFLLQLVYVLALGGPCRDRLGGGGAANV